MKKVLVLEDESSIRSFIVINLIRAGYEVVEAETGEEALEKLSENPDVRVTLLDIMLPGIDGYDVLREIRKQYTTPVIMLSAKGETFDKVLGLELGADDYIIKPFEPKEVVARVKAVLRRFDNQQARVASAAKDEPKDVVTYDGLVISLANYSVTDHEKPIEMPPKELELLYFLASHPNQVFTREQLLDQIWGYEYIGETRTVDVHIKRIREKLTENPAWSLTTVWGIGYKFEVNA